MPHGNGESVKLMPTTTTTATVAAAATALAMADVIPAKKRERERGNTDRLLPSHLMTTLTSPFASQKHNTHTHRQTQAEAAREIELYTARKDCVQRNAVNAK